MNSSSQLHSIGKGSNTGRSPNRRCSYCCRKKVYPEKCNGSGKWWRYPSSQECFDCVMVHDGIFDQIRRRHNKRNKFIVVSHGSSLGPIFQSPDNLVDFGGNGKYRSPEFTWLNTT